MVLKDVLTPVETPENSDVDEDEVDDISLLLPGSINLVQLLQGNRHVCVQAMTNIDTDVHGTNGPRYVNSLYMQFKANKCCSLLNRGLPQDFTPTVS